LTPFSAPRVSFLVLDENLRWNGTPVGQASACLLLTSMRTAKIKTRQAEACPTKIVP
jgi:hypothetical protein